jgi:hypothetical protein
VNRPTLDYLVGIFDGEGCITTAQSGERLPHVHVQVTISTREIVECLQREWGGSVKDRRAISGRRQLFVWRLTGRAAEPMLRVIAARGLIKREQAILALQLIALSGPSGGRGTYRVSDDDRLERLRLSDAIRALNGARARFV